jgi:hypothetical protein
MMKAVSNSDDRQLDSNLFSLFFNFLMSSQTKLEINGSLSEHSIAELLIETTDANLSGSFRLAKDEQKTIIYLSDGKVVFAVSNLRQHRLFSIALNEKKVFKEQLQTLPNIGNDMEFGANLLEKNYILQEDLDKLTSKQVEEILRFCLGWTSGEWIFSSLARIKESINFEVDLHKLLLDFSRSLAPDYVLERFKSNEESFQLKSGLPLDLNLQSHEAFVLSRFEGKSLTIDEIDTISGLPENITRQVLYNLWFGGFLSRQNWNSVLSENTIANILSANLRLVTEKVVAETDSIPSETPLKIEDGANEEEIIPEQPEEVDEEKSLLEYLERNENAVNLYETIGVAPEAGIAEIKQAYFAQAKKYHPDLFHRNTEFYQRVQDAFTNLAHAYETLKTEESRDLYNYKMRKELADMRERQKSGISDDEANLNKQIEQGAKNFDIGLQFLQQDEIADAVTFFARAVHFDENNARYHAFYGKALSFDKKNLHKAEAELQTAIKIEPEVTTYRLMLAELFIYIGLKKRAEGELTRLLAIAPNDKDALALLDSLQKK